MWRFKVHRNTLLAENDTAITSLFLQAASSALEALQRDDEGLMRADVEDRLSAALSKAAEGWAVTLKRLRPEVDLIENVDHQAVALRLLDRVTDNFELAFNHVLLLQQYLQGGLWNSEGCTEESPVGRRAYDRVARLRTQPGFMQGCQRGLRARHEDRIIPWNRVRQELGIGLGFT